MKLRVGEGDESLRKKESKKRERDRHTSVGVRVGQTRYSLAVDHGYSSLEVHRAVCCRESERRTRWPGVTESGTAGEG